MPRKPNGAKNTKWEDGHAEKIRGYLEEGFTLKETAAKIGCAQRTLMYWVKNKEELKDLPDWKEEADRKVERSLFRKCLGFEVEITSEKLTQNGEVVSVTEKKYYAPDTRAIEFWLKNRKPKEWLENLRMDINVGALSNKELVRLAQLAIEKLKKEECEV